MEIVASSLVMRKFRTIKEFQMDLGISKVNETKKEGNKGPGQIVIKIKDPFVKRYSIEKGNYIVKSGNIGSLGFYIDNNLGNDQFSIYDQDKQYDFYYKETGDVRSYLSDILEKIMEQEVEAIELEQNLEEGIEFRMDKNLPQSEFIEEYMKMKDDMSKMNINPNKH